MLSEHKVSYEVDLSEPSEELLEWAKENIAEDPDNKYLLIEELRDMIYAKGECTPLRTDDAFLLRFLRARHFIVKLAHRLFVRYHEFRDDNRQFFENVNLVELSKIGDENIIVVPPYRENTGRRMVLYRAEQWDPERYTVDQLFQATLALLEIAIMEESVQILGGVCVFDFQNLTMQQALYFTPKVARKVFQIMVSAFPIRIHAVHILNQSYVFDVMYNILKPFLKNVMQQRIYFHGDNLESLHQHIDPKYLPVKYGGIQPDFTYKDWIAHIRSNDKVRNDLVALGYKEVDDNDIDK